jgi:hypothetical protein
LDIIVPINEFLFLKIMKKYFSTFISLLLVILPVIATLLWHLHNQGWPNDDAADYMKTAYQQYLAFQDGSLLDGLKALYQIRGWRPILFPVLATPFLLFFKGYILAATGATLIICFLVCQIYIYAIARLYLDSFRASLVAALVGTSSVNIFYSMVFFSEIAWFAFFTGFAFHLLKSEYFFNYYHAGIAGIFLGLATLIRPAETFAIAIIPLTGIIIIALTKNVFTIFRAMSVVGFVTLNICLLISSIFIKQTDHYVILGAGFIIILLQLFLMKNGKKIEPGLLGLNMFAVLFMLINLFWWASSMSLLYSWIYDTTFGFIAHTDIAVRQEGLFPVLWRIFSKHFSPNRIWIILLCLPLLLPGHESNRGKIKRLGILAMITLGLLLPMCFLYVLTGTSDFRRMFVGMSFLLILISILSLQDGPLRKVRTGILSLMVALQIAGLLWNARGVEIPFTIPILKPYDASLKPRTKPDQNETVILRLLELGVPPKSSIAVYTATIFQYRDRIYEPAALSLAALTTGSNLKIIYFVETGEYSKVIKRLRENGVSFLLIDVYNDIENKVSPHPLVHFTSSLLRKMEAPGVDPPGLLRMAAFKIGGRDQVLFRVLPSDKT